MRYFIQQNGILSQVDELTNPSYLKDLLSKGAMELTEQEYKERTHTNEPVFDEAEYKKQARIDSIKARLTELDKDMIQYMYGEDVPNLQERKREFIELHNELRILEGKQPRTNNLNERRI